MQQVDENSSLTPVYIEQAVNAALAWPIFTALFPARTLTS